MRHVLVLAIALTLPGCEDRAKERRAAEERKLEEQRRKDQLFETHGRDVRRLIARAESTRAQLPKIPRAKPGDAPPRTTPPMKLSELDMNDPAGNADLLFENELALFRRGMLGTCSYYLRQGTADVTASLVEDVFKRGLRTKHFLVVRVDEQKKPKVGPGGNTYTDGTLDGDVVVFDLGEDPPKVLGSFPLQAELTEKVKVSRDASRESVQHALDEALRKTALVAVAAKLGAP